jgi:hypothetical protein
MSDIGFPGAEVVVGDTVPGGGRMMAHTRDLPGTIEGRGLIDEGAVTQAP